MTRDSPVADVDRLIVRAPNWVGDAIMALPALRAVRTRFPEAVIAIVGRPYVTDIYRHQEMCDQFIPYDSKGLHAAFSGRERLAADLREHMLAGRLSPDELEERLELVYAAKTRGELHDIGADLPMGVATLKAAALERTIRLRRRLIQESGGVLGLWALCIGIWAASGATLGAPGPARMISSEAYHSGSLYDLPLAVSMLLFCGAAMAPPGTKDEKFPASEPGIRASVWPAP